MERGREKQRDLPSTDSPHNHSSRGWAMPTQGAWNAVHVPTPVHDRDLSTWAIDLCRSAGTLDPKQRGRDSSQPQPSDRGCGHPSGHQPAPHGSALTVFPQTLPAQGLRQSNSVLCCQSLLQVRDKTVRTHKPVTAMPEADGWRGGGQGSVL